MFLRHDPSFSSINTTVSLEAVLIIMIVISNIMVTQRISRVLERKLPNSFSPAADGDIL